MSFPLSVRSFNLLGLYLLFASSGAVANSEKLVVGVSIPPQEFFLQQIAGDRLDILVLLEHGGDPHTHEPGPRQMEKLSHARLYFAAGLEIEKKWKPQLLKSRATLKWIPPMEGLTRDSHYWLSPQMVIRQVDTMLEALSAHDPSHAGLYRENGEVFRQELLALDANLSDTFANLDGRNTFLVAHPAWDEFARAYGLNQIVIESEGKSLTPRRIVEIVRTAKNRNISTVFADHGHGLKHARAIAESINAEVTILDPISSQWLADLKQSANRIREALR